MHVLGCLVGFFCQVKSVRLAYLFWYYLLLGMCIEVGDIMFFFLHQECANQPTFTSASFLQFSVPRCIEINPNPISALHSANNIF